MNQTPNRTPNQAPNQASTQASRESRSHPQPTVQVRAAQGQPAAAVNGQAKPPQPPAQKQHPALRGAVRPETVPPLRAQPAVRTMPAAEFRGNPERLIAVLEKCRTLYRQLHELAKTRRATLRAGDFAGFSRIDEPEKRIVAQIEELDQMRLGESKAIAARVGLASDASLVEIAEKLPPATGARIIALREELRTLVLEVRRESSVVRQAAERLSAHIAGIVQSVHSVLAHANIYSSGGQIATVGGGVISSLDIRS